MRHMTLACLGLILLFSCNDKLWEEIDLLTIQNKAQANRLYELQQEINNLTNTLQETEMQLVDLITFGDEYNAEQIENSNNLIAENAEAIQALSDSLDVHVDDLVTEIQNVQQDASNALTEAVELLEAEDEILDSLISVNVSDLENLQAQVDSIQPVINNYTLVNNVVDTSELEDRVSDIEAQLACSDYDEAEPYVLPDFEWVSLRNIRAYTESCDGDGEILIDSLYTVSFGDRYRAYTTKDGWIGTYGVDENKMNIKGWPEEDKCYEGLGLWFNDDDVPSIGVQVQGELEDSEYELSYEFDEATGEYEGCVNTSDDVEYYVNGVLQEGNTFTVGDLIGKYIITVKVNDELLQHEVELCDTCKPVKKLGKVKKSKKVVI